MIVVMSLVNGLISTLCIGFTISFNLNSVPLNLNSSLFYAFEFYSELMEEIKNSIFNGLHCLLISECYFYFHEMQCFQD